MNKSVPFIIAACALAAPAFAQKPAAPAATVVTSTPGQAAAVTTAEVTAAVVGVDKATRTITLKGPHGKALDVVAGEGVRNFDQIKVGDSVMVKYQEALTIGLKKTNAPASVTGSAVEGRSAPGERPAGVLGREIVVLADVVGVDPKKSVISLKGPRGNVVDLTKNGR